MHTFYISFNSQAAFIVSPSYNLGRRCCGWTWVGSGQLGPIRNLDAAVLQVVGGALGMEVDSGLSGAF
jgi:hypothetical protein